MDYMSRLIAERRRNPGEGVLDDLLAQHGANDDADHDELVSTLVVQVAGSHGTTGSMIALGLFALLQHPEQLAELRADPSFFITSLINRDTDVHDAPNSLGWRHASAADHLTFGFGAHQCLGQSLARITMEIALGALIDRRPDLPSAVPAGTLREDR